MHIDHSGQASKKRSAPDDGDHSKSPQHAKKVALSKPPSAADLSHIQLPGEEDESVPIYATCEDIRRQINDHLRKPGVTQAGFCRELKQMMPTQDVNTRHLGKFLNFTGPRAGGHSPVFYSGYVFFEKLRLHEGKKKSAKMQKLEDAWKEEGGFPREGSHNKHIFCIKGESWKFDYLGQIQIKGTPTGGAIMRKKARRH